MGPIEEFEFCSRGAVLRGRLHLGAGDGPRPGVVLAHGLSAVREMFLDEYAAVFARKGITALSYDHPGFGASDGEVRQCPSPSLQLAGYRDAVAALGADRRVDPGRIGLWGSSFSGGEVILLASEELPVACAVAQVPFLGEGGPDLPSGGLAAIGEALAEGRDDAVVPAVTSTAEGCGVMFEDGAYDWFTSVAARRAPSWRNELRVSGLLEAFRPVDHLASARVPLLLLVAPADRLTPPTHVLGRAGEWPLVEIAPIAGGHFDCYEAGFAESAGAAADFLARHLRP